MVMSGITPSATLTDINQPQQTVKEVFKGMGRLSFSYAKNFMVVGAIYSGSECVIESVRFPYSLFPSLAPLTHVCL